MFEKRDDLLATNVQRQAYVQVVQTLSAGVNMVTPYVQPHMTLCNASGSHDVAVAEW